MNQNIVFFDGDCLLCNKVVKWIVKHEKPEEDLLNFAPLEGETAKEMLSGELLSEPFENMIYRSSEGVVFTGAKAVRALRPYLKVWPGFMLVFIREFNYRLVASNRGIWGRLEYDACNYSYIASTRILK